MGAVGLTLCVTVRSTVAEMGAVGLISAVLVTSRVGLICGSAGDAQRGADGQRAGSKQDRGQVIQQGRCPGQRLQGKQALINRDEGAYRLLASRAAPAAGQQIAAQFGQIRLERLPATAARPASPARWVLNNTWPAGTLPTESAATGVGVGNGVGVEVGVGVSVGVGVQVGVSVAKMSSRPAL